MMKNLLTIVLVIFTSACLFGQQLNADDRVTITQSTKPFIGVYAFGYQGLPTPGYPQFQLNNYGGTPGSEAATADNSILGLFAFSGHNGSAKRTVGIVRVKAMNDFATNLSSRMDFLIGPNREQRMTIIGDSGYVGIGTALPTTELDVNGQIRMQTGAANGYIPVSNADGVMTWTDPSAIVGGGSSLWEESGANVYRPTGNVGVGGVPNAKLHIRADGTTLNDGIRMTSSVNTSEDWYAYMDAEDNFNFRDDAVEVMTLQNSTGNVGIGTISPEHKLDIYKSGNTTVGITANAAANTGVAELRLKTNETINDELFIKKYGSGAGGTLNNGLSLANMSVITSGAAAGPLYTGTIGDHPVYLASSNEVAVFLDTDQDVGVNTQNPGAQLHVLETEGTNTSVLFGQSTYSGNSDRYAIQGSSVNNPGYGYGGYFEGGYKGVYARANSTTYTGTTTGMHGYASGSAGNRRGVYGQASNSGGLTSYGVQGVATGATTNYGIYGQASSGTNNWAGYFAGDVRVTGTLDNTSDARLKKDIEDMDNALDIINQLQPKTYEFRADEYPHMALDTRPQLGFIAQDMEKVLPQLVRTAYHPEFINDEGEESDIPNSPAVDVKSINYIGIIPVLTQGIKELAGKVEEKDEAIEELTNKVALLEDQLSKIENVDQLLSQISAVEDRLANLDAMTIRMEQLEKDLQSCCLNSNAEPKEAVAITSIELNGNKDEAQLSQNAPNPFNAETSINYYVPASATKAQLTITDMKGAILKSVNLEATGFGTVNVMAGELAPGTYAYTLTVDGERVETKQMVLVK